MASGDAPSLTADEVILVRYGEVGIKSDPVRSRFEKALVKNIEEGLARAGVAGRVQRARGRVFVEASREPALRLLAHTFGVVSASPAVVVPPHEAAIADAAVEAARRVVTKRGETFGVRARRTGVHPFTSMELARVCGTRIQESLASLAPKVDLDQPQHEIHVEARSDAAYVFTQIVPGPGGLPLGTQGHVTILLENQASLLAAWLMMKRGCRVTFLAPKRDEDALLRGVQALVPWGGPREVTVFSPPADPEPCLSRAVALRVAEQTKGREHVGAIVTGDTLGDVDSFSPLDRWVRLPVMRPLVGYTNTEREERCKGLGFPDFGPAPGQDPGCRFHPPQPAQVDLLASMAMPGMSVVRED